MSALQDWLDFCADLAHPPSRDGFCSAWRQMTSGKEPSPETVTAFGKTVVRLFIHACDDCQARGEMAPSIQAGLHESLTTGLLYGFKPKDYGYDISIRKLKTDPERVH